MRHRGECMSKKGLRMIRMSIDTSVNIRISTPFCRIIKYQDYCTNIIYDIVKYSDSCALTRVYFRLKLMIFFSSKKPPFVTHVKNHEHPLAIQ